MPALPAVSSDSSANLPHVTATPHELEAAAYARQKFLLRARTLFFARLALLAVGLLLFLVPAWSETFDLASVRPLSIYLVMVAYSAANYVFVERPRLGPALTFFTLCLDLIAIVYLVVVSGGLQSPLLATQVLFTTLFVMLFPRPLAIIPPLLTFPVVAQIQHFASDDPFTATDVFVLIWYSALNCLVVYLIVYLNSQEEMKHRENLRLQHSVRDLAVAEERARLAREIHDGLGGSLSSLILQAEYLHHLAPAGELRDEIGELKGQAEESIEELRRSLTLMRADFDLVRGMEDACRRFESRQRGLTVRFACVGKERPVSSEAALTLFRVLQESLTNVARHAHASHADVRLAFDGDDCVLTVQDDGRGFNDSAPPPPGHYGLLNMRERAQRIGGTAHVESTLGKGTLVRLSVPYNGEPAPASVLALAVSA